MFGRARRSLRKHPLLAGLALLLLLLLGAGSVTYLYVWRQWHVALVAVKDNRAVDAEAPLDLCLRVWPRSVPVQLLAARAARMRGDFSECEERLNHCLKLAPTARDAVQLEFLLLRVQGGEIDQVEEPLLNCVENGHPESAIILETMAGAYMRNLRYAPALNALDRWIALVPDSAIAHRYRGWVLDRANNTNGAIAAFRRSVELDPSVVYTNLRLAELLLQENDTPEAVEILERLHRRHPDRADVMARLGQCRYSQGRTDEARELLEAAETELPDDPLLLVHLAKLLAQQKQPVEAERRLRHLLKLDPADSEGMFLLVNVLRQQSRHKEADEALERYRKTQALLKRLNILLRNEVDRVPNDPGAPFEVGHGLLSVGQERLGLHWLHEALRRDPRHQESHKALAEYYEKTKDREKAAYHRRQIDATTPKSR